MPRKKDAIILVAQYAYETRGKSDLRFKKHDRMLLLDDSNADWWYVQHIATKEKGYVPRDFVACGDSLESEEWYHKRTTRLMAEMHLSKPSAPRGTFLIRERKPDRGKFALTIKDYDEQRGGNFKHYKIARSSSGRYYIKLRESYPIMNRPDFATLQDLVKYYSETAHGMCSKLTLPCPKDADYGNTRILEISRRELSFKKKVGAGYFGEVWYGKWRNTVDVAIKTLKPNTMSPAAFLEEAAIMKQCDHPNLVKLYAVCSKEDPLYIVTEFMCSGNLLEYLRQGAGQNLQLNALVDIANQVARGMSYLEERRIVHRDLAARNVLLGREIPDVPRMVKVADFGLARVLEGDQYTPRNCMALIPRRWTAPEAARYGSFTIKSDVWSYGVLLYEIVTKGQVPYPGR